MCACPQGIRSAFETRLINQTRAARRLLADHEAVAKLALDSMARKEGAPGLGALSGAPSPVVARLEEEYRAKVVELESKMATANLQVRH